ALSPARPRAAPRPLQLPPGPGPEGRERRAMMGRPTITALSLGLSALLSTSATAGDDATRPYGNRLTPIVDPQPIPAHYPEFLEPIRETARFEAPILVDDPEADLEVRSWRFSYNARGIVEVPQRLRADRTAIIVVHPWGIDDGGGWATPEPAGVAFQ